MFTTEIEGVIPEKDDDKIRGKTPQYDFLSKLELEQSKRHYQANKAYYDALMVSKIVPFKFKPLVIGTGGDCHGAEKK